MGMFMEFDIHHAPAQAAQAIPAGVPADQLEVLLPVNAGGPVQGFIKQEIPRPNGGNDEVYYPFGFNMPDPVAAAPAAPAEPAAPAAPAEPALVAVAAAPAEPALVAVAAA